MNNTKEYACRYCGLIFNDKRKLSAHVTNVCSPNKQQHKSSKIDYVFTCTICGTQFTKCMTPYMFNKLSKNNKLPRTCCSFCAHKLSSINRDKEAAYAKVSSSLKSYHKTQNQQHILKIAKIHTCKVCGTEYKNIKGTTKNCCSIECSKYLRSHIGDYDSEETKIKRRLSGIKSANSQCRRSKNEKYFCELCESYFKNVENNVPMFNGWDADVIIHDIKYAILWNGVWHYKQISLKSSLKQIQTRDNIKIKEITKSGYTPYIIKDMGGYNETFVKEQFDIFINKINADIV